MGLDDPRMGSDDVEMASDEVEMGLDDARMGLTQSRYPNLRNRDRASAVYRFTNTHRSGYVSALLVMGCPK